MNIDLLTQKYATLSQIERCRALAQVSWHLTVLAREFYRDDNCPGESRLISINEFQHRISRMIIDNVEGTSFRSDQELVEYLTVGLQEFGAAHLLEQILK